MNWLSRSRICCRNVDYFTLSNRATTVNLPCKRYLSTSQLKEFLSILKVGKDSTPKEIKESFLKLSKIYHPDNKNTGSHTKFVKLKEAYDAIKDGAPTATPDSNSKSNMYNYYDDIDLSHKAHAQYRERYRDYQTSYRQSSNAYGFGGPYRESSTPWEDLKREKEFRRQRGFASKGQPLIQLTIFLGAIAWIFIYASALLIWDYNDQVKKGLSKFERQNYEDYVAYRDYLRRKEAAKRRERPNNGAAVGTDNT